MRNLVLFVVIAVPTIAVLTAAAHRRERIGLGAAAAEGALWGGMANMDAKSANSILPVQRALAGVGDLYGAKLSVMRWRPRPVAGVLLVHTDRLCWHPRSNPGHGRALPWDLTRDQVASWSLKRPRPKIHGWRLTLRSHDGGQASLDVLNHDELFRALEVAFGSSSSNGARGSR